MQQLVLVFTAAALLSTGCSSINVNRHMKIRPDLDNSIEPIAQTKPKQILTLTQRPTAINFHPSGTTLELTCEALGTPAPTVHWFKNDAPVYEHDLESNELLDFNPTSVGRISSILLVPRTEGHDKYTCLVTAGMKTASATTMIYSTDGNTDLSERSKLAPLAPRVVVSYILFMDTIGNNIIIPCKVKGHPRPHITWKNNKGVDVKKDPRMQVLRSGELMISPLLWSDMGDFTCQVSNVFGRETITTFVYPIKAE